MPMKAIGSISGAWRVPIGTHEAFQRLIFAVSLAQALGFETYPLLPLTILANCARSFSFLIRYGSSAVPAPSSVTVCAACAGAAPRGRRLTRRASASRALVNFLPNLHMGASPFRAARGHEKQTHGGRGSSTHRMRL